MDSNKIVEVFIESTRASQETNQMLQELALCLKETNTRLAKLEKETKSTKRAYHGDWY